VEQSAEAARQKRHPVPAEAVKQVEKWLLATWGSELRKAKSLETALRAVTHVAFVWSSCSESADDPLHDDSLANATTRPPRDLSLDLSRKGEGAAEGDRSRARRG
jgi:hypothetical protein